MLRDLLKEFDYRHALGMLAGIFLLVTVISWIQMRHMNNVQWTAKWQNFSPAERYPDVVDEFGEPDLLDPTIGGGAIWFGKTLKKRGHCMEQLMILDEAIPHDSPAPHADFLYSWYKIDIPDKRVLRDILGLSKSVSYDPLKKLIQVRCHFMGANRATMLLAQRMAMGDLTLNDIEENELYKKYIMRTAPSSETYDHNAETEYDMQICEYQEMLNRN